MEKHNPSQTRMGRRLLRTPLFSTAVATSVMKVVSTIAHRSELVTTHEVRDAITTRSWRIRSSGETYRCLWLLDEMEERNTLLR